MPEGILPRLSYRLRDPNTDAIVVDNLYHLHQSEWTVRALLPGYPGSATLGDFKIVLPAPYQDEFRDHITQYNAILNASNRGIGLKVEAWHADIDTGDPILSGVITKMNLPLDGPWELTGQDTLWWLQQSQTWPSESFSGPILGDSMILAFSGTVETLWDDDFSNWNGTSSSGHPASSDYTVSSSGGTTWTRTTDPVFGLPALVSSGTGDGRVITNTQWAENRWGAAFSTTSGAMATLQGVMILGSPGAGSTAGAAELYVSASTNGNSGYLALVRPLDQGTGLYNITVELYSVTGGVFTLVASAANVFTNIISPMPFELSIVTGKAVTTSLDTQVRVFLNGKDTGVFTTASAPFSTHTPGGIGARYGTGISATGSPAMYIFRMRLQSRTDQRTSGGWGTNRFQVDIFSNTGNLLGSPLDGRGQTHLDLILAGASVEGALIRKDPVTGFKSDILLYATDPVGGNTFQADLTSAVYFEENVNVIPQNSSLINVADLYSTDVRLNAIPGTDSGGTITWGKVGAPGDMVLLDTVSDVGHTGFGFLVNYIKEIQERKQSPVVAMQLNVIRSAELIWFNNGWGPRELDLVTINMPTYGISYQHALIVGYTINETEASIVYYLTQFPENVMVNSPLQRIIRTLDFLSTNFQVR